MQQTVKCPSCGADCAGPQFCTTCGTRLPLVMSQTEPETQPVVISKPTIKEATPTVKYGTLKAVATVYRIIGWVVIVGGSLFAVALAVMALGAAGTLTDFLPLTAGVGTVAIAITGLIVSILSGLFLIAFADVCYVLIDIEKNTRSKS